MYLKRQVRDERGVALVLVLFVALVVGSISAGAAMIGSNVSMIKRHSDRQSTLVAAAEAGLEEARSLLNGTTSPYPDSAYVTLENGAAVYNADGTVIPGFSRWTYAGPSGITSGQYGIFGSVISVVEDAAGNRLVRRAEIAQESFAKYAYFTDFEDPGNRFCCGMQMFGPVHSNSPIRYWSVGLTTFHGPLTTAQTVERPWYGVYNTGYVENVPVIPMPTTTDLAKLSAQASSGGTNFASTTLGSRGEATTRIEFIAIDLNGDNDSSDVDEGFIAVYQGADPSLVSAHESDVLNSQNCGDFSGVHGGGFVSVNAHPANGHSQTQSLNHGTTTCFLGGDAALTGGAFQAATADGAWVQWSGTVDPRIAASGQVPAGMESYLIPINRQLNPNFKGVIYVSGKVAVSGVLRGRVTMAASDNISLVDDLTYVTDPGAGLCDADILGLFSGNEIMISDNQFNAPQSVSGAWRTLDDTKDEFLHGVVLALNVFEVENWWSGATAAEPCGLIAWGRGCLYLTGGVIQQTRGIEGVTNGTGYIPEYSYDLCAASNPPPYFPTTGHFVRGRYFEIDPVGFNVNSYWAMLTPP